MVFYNLKIYEHEDSPQDEVFRRASSYQEVLSQFQSLALDKLVEFYNFHKHQRNNLPKVLQGEILIPLATQRFDI
jgi:hypothetical protein